MFSDLSESVSSVLAETVLVFVCVYTFGFLVLSVEAGADFPYVQIVFKHIEIECRWSLGLIYEPGGASWPLPPSVLNPLCSIEESLLTQQDLFYLCFPSHQPVKREWRRLTVITPNMITINQVIIFDLAAVWLVDTHTHTHSSIISRPPSSFHHPSSEVSSEMTDSQTEAV